MDALGPWLAVAALGAVHGASPANGWLFASLAGVRQDAPGSPWRALPPIAAGHVASVAVVAWAMVQGWAMDTQALRSAAGALLIGIAMLSLLRRGRRCTAGTARAGLAGWSFVMATVHGTGLMLVPALAPLCLTTGPARELTATGAWLLAGG